MSTIIDAKGKPCPTPVILAKQAMAAGEHSFTVLVDNTTAVENLKRLAGNQGFGAAVTQGEGVFSVAFTRTGCAACEEAVSAPLVMGHTKRNWGTLKEAVLSAIKRYLNRNNWTQNGISMHSGPPHS